MTNREWLNSLSDEEFVKVLHQCNDCHFCMFDKWLDEKRTEPMPKLQLGDIVVTNFGWSYVAISPVTLVCRNKMVQHNIEDINNIITLIQRYDGKVYQTIWRANNE